MSDIRTAWRDLAGDWLVSGPQLQSDDGLETAVLLSLFTDRTADPGEAEGEQLGARRGWWGDAYGDRGDRIGSRLWLLKRSKQLPEVVARAQAYAQESLQWLVLDGVARRVEVQAEISAPGVLGLQVSIERSNAPVLQYRFETFWSGR